MTLLLIVTLAVALGAVVLRGRGRNRGDVLAVAATLTLGLAGYAATGRPGLGARSERRIAENSARIGGYEQARGLLLPTTGATGAWLAYADALSRDGETLVAIRGLERALADTPADADLWTGLGEALARHGDDRVGPASELAFARAAQLAPGNPSPRYFYGLALLRTGAPAAALGVWSTIAPAARNSDSGWRLLLSDRIAAARQMLR